MILNAFMKPVAYDSRFFIWKVLSEDKNSKGEIFYGKKV